MQEFIIHIVKGEVKNIKVLANQLSNLTDGRYKVRIDSAKKRNVPLNKYYWAVVVDMVYYGLRDAGFDSVRNKNDAHEILKALFLKITDEKNGIKIERILSTTELTNTGFQEYLLNISVWAFDYLNVTIPEPNQQLEMPITQ